MRTWPCPSVAVKVAEGAGQMGGQGMHEKETDRWEDVQQRSPWAERFPCSAQASLLASR